MTTFLQSLATWQSVFFWVGIGLIIVLLLNLIFDHDGIFDFANFIPMRGIIAAGAMFCLSLSILSTSALPFLLSIVISVLLGLLIGFATIKTTNLMKNKDTGNISEQSLIGLEGVVTTRIPVGERGQVKLTYKGHEDVWLAQSDSAEEIPAGTRVWVFGVPQMSVLSVRPE